MAALFLMCDARDIRVTVEENQRTEPDVQSNGSIPQSGAGIGAGLFEPNIFIYDNYPGGIGLSAPLYEMHDRVLKETARLIRSCPCKEGCPSCVGPRGSIGDLSKQVALEILEQIL
jgi:DEAD/DEAH box helicase domain-containing protein